MSLDRGADFISTGKRQPGKLAWPGKGKPPKESYLPNMVSGTQSEYAADCHISGALSKYAEVEGILTEYEIL